MLTISSCSLSQKSIYDSKISTLKIITTMSSENGLDRKELNFDLIKTEKKSDSIIYSFKKKNNYLPYLISKYSEGGKFISALYFPTLEHKIIKKEELFDVLGLNGWEKKQDQLSAHDLTLKVLYLNKFKNVMFGFYEINERNVQFIYVGSDADPASFRDLFLF